MLQQRLATSVVVMEDMGMEDMVMEDMVLEVMVLEVWAMVDMGLEDMDYGKDLQMLSLTTL